MIWGNDSIACGALPLGSDIIPFYELRQYIKGHPGRCGECLPSVKHILSLDLNLEENTERYAYVRERLLRLQPFAAFSFPPYDFGYKEINLSFSSFFVVD